MKTLVLGLVLLAANIVAAHADDRKCIDAKVIDRLCDTKKYVTNPNEYGWSATAPECRPQRAKGWGWKQKKDVACDCLPQCGGGE